jgi:sulfatase maturation enzyme AslB (radical SAM superfamily)
MTIETAIKCIDWIFNNVPQNIDGVEIDFIGGEPLLEFELLKSIVSYTCSKYKGWNRIFYASTNGVFLNDEMKHWFTAHKKCFVLGLSLDGAKETHDANRDKSFDSIDFNFFLSNWPEQGVKMTLSGYSLPRFAENIKFIHSLGFKEISGVNLAEGNFDWNNEKYIKVLVPQLVELTDFYVENDSLLLNQMFDKKFFLCETLVHERRKWCGIGTGCPFFDTDGKKYPCPFITPMTFSENELDDIVNTDYNNDDNFLDEECFSSCYIYPLCPTCAGANYLNCKTFKQRDKKRCCIQKLTTLFAADIHARRIVKNPELYQDNLYSTIEAIKKIRQIYISEFREYL